MTQEENRENIMAVIALIDSMPDEVKPILAEKAIEKVKSEAHEAVKMYVGYIGKFKGFQDDFLDLLNVATSASQAEKIKADLVENQAMIDRGRLELSQVKSIIKKMDQSNNWKEILMFFTEMP